MKKILLVIFLFPFISFCQVKGGQHSKLFDMYVMEKYEDCAYKSENMVNNEKYKKDPEPLLYLSMCMYKISRMDSSELDQQYKDPLKESLKYAKKFRSKDKTGTMYNDNRDFFDELKTAAIYQANSLYNLNQFSKASAYFGMINNVDDKDHNVRFMKGVCDLLAKNAAEGAKNINDAMKGLYTSRSDSAFKPDVVSEPLLQQAMIIYSDYLKKNKQDDSAKKTITAAKYFFPDVWEIKNQYNILHDLPPEPKPEKEDLSKKTEKKYEFHQPKKDENIEIPEIKTEEQSGDTVKEEPAETPAEPLQEKTDDSESEEESTTPKNF